MLASSQLRSHWQYEAGSPLFCSQSLMMLFCALEPPRQCEGGTVNPLDDVPYPSNFTTMVAGVPL
jgi:hypothetical protein